MSYLYSLIVSIRFIIFIQIGFYEKHSQHAGRVQAYAVLRDGKERRVEAKGVVVKVRRKNITASAAGGVYEELENFLDVFVELTRFAVQEVPSIFEVCFCVIKHALNVFVRFSKFSFAF